MSSFTINRVVLVGRLTKSPELRTLPSGTRVCGLRIACNSVRRDAEGDFQDKANYFDVDVFGGQAESVKRYMDKGSRVGIDGRLEWREWEGPEKQKRQMVSVVADMVMFLDSPGDGPDNEPEDELATRRVWLSQDEEPVQASPSMWSSSTNEPRASTSTAMASKRML
jgi:single-strand DNA-binding protein